MRLVTQTELMKLPEGALYARLYRPWVFADLCIKGDNVGSKDFYERSLNWVDANDSLEAVDRLDAMMEDSTLSFPVAQAYQREGLYEQDAHYLVYELEDVKLLVGELRQAYEI